MKTIQLIVLLMLASFLSSCESTREPTPTQPDFSFEVYRDGYFQAVVPDWPENQSGDVETIFSVQNDGQFITINRYQHIPEIFAKQFRAYIDEVQTHTWSWKEK